MVNYIENSTNRNKIIESDRGVPKVPSVPTTRSTYIYVCMYIFITYIFLQLRSICCFALRFMPYLLPTPCLTLISMLLWFFIIICQNHCFRSKHLFLRKSTVFIYPIYYPSGFYYSLLRTLMNVGLMLWTFKLGNWNSYCGFFYDLF